jgi:putative transposase
VGIPRASYYRAISEPSKEPSLTTTAVSCAAPELTSEPAPGGHDLIPAIAAVAAALTCEPAPAIHPRALKQEERQLILDTLHSERFIDRAPAEVYNTLLDEGVYLASLRTYYRILAENQEVKERRAQRRHPEYHKPELIATRPNQVWTWDITKLLGPAKWVYYYLYVIIDIFSRYVVGWMLAEKEASAWAQQLIEETYEKQNIQPGQLTIHSDRGGPMQATPMVALHARLDVAKSNSRPHVSNDNPFIESHFKTLKYSPGFPRRFHGGFEEASEFCKGFFPWYCKEHRHSGIAFLTPETVHYGLADQALAERHMRLLEAYRTNPERFIQGPPKPRQLDRAVYINPPKPSPATAGA